MKILERYIHKETQKEYLVMQYDTGFEVWVNLGCGWFYSPHYTYEDIKNSNHFEQLQEDHL